MDFEKTVMTRRSVRQFKDKSISKKKIQNIIQAGIMAPSAHNQQPWKFVVVQDNQKLNKIANIHPYGSMAKQASCCIVPLIDKEKMKDEKFVQQDMAACIQNMLLAIRNMDLGAVWCGVYPKKTLVDKLSNFLDLDKHLEPFALIPVGHTDQKQGKADRNVQDLIDYID